MALAAILVLTPRYTANALLVVNNAEGGDVGRHVDDDAIDTPIAAMTSDAHLERVLAATKQDPHFRKYRRVNEIKRRLKVMQVLRSHFVAVEFIDRSPDVAAAVANEIAQLYIDEIMDPTKGTTAQALEQQQQRLAKLEEEYRQAAADLGAGHGQSEPGNLRRVDALRRKIDSAKMWLNLTRSQDGERRQALALSPPVSIYALARPPERPSSIRPVLIFIPASIASLLFGAALALLLARLDRRILDAGDLQWAFSSPVLGSIPPKTLQAKPEASREGAVRRLAARLGVTLSIFSQAQHDLSYEGALRRLAARLFLASKSGDKRLVLVAGTHEVARTDFAFDLALAASQMKTVLLVTAGDEALTARYAKLVEEALSDGAQIDFRSLAGNSSQLLVWAASDVLPQKLAELRRDYDWIVLASPPPACSPAVGILATMADSVVLNVIEGLTTYEDVATSLREITCLGEPAFRLARQSRLAFVFNSAANAAPEANEIARLVDVSSTEALTIPIDAQLLQGGRQASDFPEARRWIGALTRRVATSDAAGARLAADNLDAAVAADVTIKGAAK